MIVPDYIPDETVPLLYADGGTGKSYLKLQLAIARALAKGSCRPLAGLSSCPQKTTEACVRGRSRLRPRDAAGMGQSPVSRRNAGSCGGNGTRDLPPLAGNQGRGWTSTCLVRAAARGAR